MRVLERHDVHTALVEVCGEVEVSAWIGLRKFRQIQRGGIATTDMHSFLHPGRNPGKAAVERLHSVSERLVGAAREKRFVDLNPLAAGVGQSLDFDSKDIG